MRKVREMPDKERMIVFGFIHEMESILHSNNDNEVIIPDLVAMIILCFYYNVARFNKWGDAIIISGQDDNILTCSSVEDSYSTGIASAFIENPIDSMDDKIVKCSIKRACKNFGSWYNGLLRTFGICSDIDCDLNDDFDCNGWQFAYYIQPDTAGSKWKIDADQDIDGDIHSYEGIRLMDEDSDCVTFTLILDLPNTSISFDREKW